MSNINNLQQQIDYLNRIDKALSLALDFIIIPPPSKVQQFSQYLMEYRSKFQKLEYFGKDYVRHLNNMMIIASQNQNLDSFSNFVDDQGIPIIDSGLIMNIFKGIQYLPNSLYDDCKAGCMSVGQYNQIMAILFPKK